MYKIFSEDEIFDFLFKKNVDKGEKMKKKSVTQPIVFKIIPIIAHNKLFIVKSIRK